MQLCLALGAPFSPDVPQPPAVARLHAWLRRWGPRMGRRGLLVEDADALLAPLQPEVGLRAGAWWCMCAWAWVCGAWGTLGPGHRAHAARGGPVRAGAWGTLEDPGCGHGAHAARVCRSMGYAAGVCRSMGYAAVWVGMREAGAQA
jgi:hypothetical protein